MTRDTLGGVSCPDQSCGERAPSPVVRELAAPEVAAKLRSFDMHNFVQQSKVSHSTFPSCVSPLASARACADEAASPPAAVDAGLVSWSGLRGCFRARAGINRWRARGVVPIVRLPLLFPLQVRGAHAHNVRDAGELDG